MAIDVLNTGTAAGSGDGESLRSAMTKVNSNFGVAENAASKIVQASSADTTSDKVMLTDHAWRGAQLGDYFTYGGTANAITLTSANLRAGGTLIKGMKFRFEATTPNTGATTIAVDGGSAIACVTPTGVALPAGFIRTDVFTECEYDGANFVVMPAIISSSPVIYDDLLKKDSVNFDLFGGLSANDDIGRGFATSATTCAFYLPLNSTVAPTSITVTGNFSVLNATSTLTTGITSITLGSTSNNKMCVISMSITGGTAGEILTLRTGTSSSSIKVNF